MSHTHSRAASRRASAIPLARRQRGSRAITVSLVLLSLACNFLAGGGSVGGGASPSRSAIVNEIEKQVEAHDDPATAWAAATIGQTVIEGGQVRTLDESRARVDFSDGHLLRLAPKSLLTVSAYPAQGSGLSLYLDFGKLWLKVTQGVDFGDVQVQTPVGTATVRGSLMSVEYNPALQIMIITCLEGSCRVLDLAGRTTDLSAGAQSEVSGPGGPPTPSHPMDATQLADWALIPEAAAALAGSTATATPPAGGGQPGGGTVDGYAAQTACDHPYFPLRSGATWTYAHESGETLTWTVTQVSGDLASAQATMEGIVNTEEGQVTLTYHWTCDANGGVFAPEWGVVAANLPGEFVNFQVTRAEGAFLAPADQMAVGDSWSNDFTYGFDVQPADAPTAIHSDINRDETYTAQAAETVSVPAGTFDALHVITTYNQTNVTNAFGQIVTNTGSGTGDLWLAWGVGMLRNVTRSDSEQSTTELVSYSIP